jgi:hypothetical protein
MEKIIKEDNSTGNRLSIEKLENGNVEICIKDKVLGLAIDLNHEELRDFTLQINQMFLGLNKPINPDHNETPLSKKVKELMREGHVPYNEVATVHPTWSSREISDYISNVCYG